MGSYLLIDTQSGKKTLLYRNGREIRLHSAYDPVKEAERSVSVFRKGRASFLIVSGIGLGFHIDALKKKYPDTPILAIEPEREVIQAATATYPEHLHGVTLITEGSDLGRIFESLDMAEFFGVSHYIHNPSYQIRKEFYDRTIADINQYISSKVSDLLTRFEFEALWIENIFSNIHRLASSAQVKDLFGRFRGYPGIIVSAGPSLRKNIRHLQAMRERAVIVCVDTAAKVLEKMRVTPHILMTLDAQKHSIRHFLGLRDHKPVLLADHVCSPKVLRLYKGRKILSTTSKYYTDMQGSFKRETTPIMDWIEQYLPPIGDLQSGGSVATSAFDLLLNLGCDPIILVGQDLAYTGREIHCSGTHHNDDWLPGIHRFMNIDTINQCVIRKRKIKYIEAYGASGTVISDFIFDLYRGWFMDSARKVSVTVINATEGGGKIANTSEESLQSLAKRLPKKSPDPDAILDGIFSDMKPGSLNDLADAIEKAITGIRGIETRAAGTAAADIEACAALIESIEESDLRLMYRPALRKANLYLTRKKVDPDKGLPLLMNEVTSASQKLASLLAQSLERIKSLGIQ